MEEEAPSSSEEVGGRLPMIAPDHGQAEWIIPDTVEEGQMEESALEIVSARDLSVSVSEDVVPQPSSSSFLPASSYFIPESPSSSGAALHLPSYPSPPSSVQPVIASDAPMLDYEAASPQPGPSGLQHFSHRSFTSEDGLDAEDTNSHAVEISHMLSPSPSSPSRMGLLPRLEEFPLEPTVTSPLQASALSAWRASPFFASPSLGRHHDMASSSLSWSSSRLDHPHMASARFIDQVSSSTGPRHQLNSTAAASLGLESLLNLADAEERAQQQVLESTVDSTCEDECYDQSPVESPKEDESSSNEDEEVVEPDPISSSEHYADLQLDHSSFAMEAPPPRPMNLTETSNRQEVVQASACVPMAQPPVEEDQRIIAGPSSSSSLMPVLSAALKESPLIEASPVVLQFPHEASHYVQEYVAPTQEPVTHQENVSGFRDIEMVQNVELQPEVIQQHNQQPGEIVSPETHALPREETGHASRHIGTLKSDFWCVLCGVTRGSHCPQHPQLLIQDKEVMSRARATLPNAYLAFAERPTQTGSLISVVARRDLPPMSRFGPVEGKFVKRKENSSTGLQFFLKDSYGNVQELDLTDDDSSNWMKFVQPAANASEQNLCLVQLENGLYFLTTRAVTAKQELKVWYSPPYAYAYGLLLLESPSGESWPCFQCDREFALPQDLQKHLKEHDLADGAHSSSTGHCLRAKRTRKGNAKSQKCRSLAQSWRSVRMLKKRALKHWQKTQVLCVVCAKVFTNRAILQRHVNAEHRCSSWNNLHASNDSDIPTEATLCCQHCRLTFDSVTLLNLHVLAHAAQAAQQQVEAVACASHSIIEMGHLGSDATDGIKHEIDVATTPNQANQCPACPQVFSSRTELITHASEHGRQQNPRSTTSSNARRPFKCDLCYGRYATEEKLTKHMAVHCEDDAKPLECSLCSKRFLSQSALTCHQKVHTETKRLLSCPICRQEFEQVSGLKQHVTSHMEGGMFRCPVCFKFFKKYAQIRKHIRSFHGETKVFCTVCGKDFTGNDKLKVHMLKHSDVKDFLCSHCGKQFKRRDKLKEHVQRMHSAESEQRKRLRAMKLAEKKKFVPKALPSEYDRFIYKCHLCLVGFKRRGTLVNHLAVRHPEVNPETIPELNLPILKTIRNYYCQYCNKVYKSSTKRKNHILKHHPGQELPLSGRVKDDEVAIPSNSYYSQTVGSVAAQPHPCAYCHKQYASRAKLLQHHRSKHPDQPSELSNAVTSDDSSGGACHEMHPQTASSDLTAMEVPSQFQISDFALGDAEIQVQGLENVDDNQRGISETGTKLFYNERLSSHVEEPMLIPSDPVARAMQDLQRSLTRPHVVPSSPTRSPGSPHFRVGAHYYRLIPLNPPALESNGEESQNLAFTEAASDPTRATLLVANAANIHVSTAVPLTHHLPGNFNHYKKNSFLEEARSGLEPTEHAHSQLQQLLAVASNENSLAEVNLGNRSWGSVAESYPAR